MNTDPVSTRKWLRVLLIGVAVLVYSDSFRGVFVFDDQSSIIDEQRIRHLWPLTAALGGTSRPLVQLSLALNYAWGELRVSGYHAFNLGVHLLAALVLMELVRRTLLTERLGGRYTGEASWLAFVVALIWVVHPLQTESVTYVIQRAESLMGLCYLSTLYCVVRAADSGRPRRWQAAAVVVCALGMASKPVMVTAPVIALMYDAEFLAGSWRRALRERAWLYLGLAATWGLLALLLVKWPEAWKESAGFGFKDVSPWQYALTQPAVILHYLKLALWPQSLCLDYAWPVARTAREIVPAALAIGILLAGTVAAFVRRSAWGFVGAWFFVVLAPTSSVIPIADLAFEHRMYLSLAAVIVLVVLAADRLLRELRWQFKGGLVAVVVATLGLLTYGRNADYHSAITLWSDTVAKRPQNARALFCLGRALELAGEKEAAVTAYLRTFSLGPVPADALLTIGGLLFETGRREDAATCFSSALRIDPQIEGAHYNLGRVWNAQGRRAEAMAEFTEELRLHPRHAKAHYHLAAALEAQGRLDDAIVHYRRAAAIEPWHPRVQLDLAHALEVRGRFNDAIFQFNEALRLEPDWIDALLGLAETYARAGRFTNAVATAESAARSARAEGRGDLATMIAQRVAAYRAGRMF